MSEVPKAIFLSYASQDAEAARHIAEALRSAGVEVWFDVEGGLEHGDEWDAKIRRQIKECVLFIPLISANTQAREEGYFRLEWDLAAERARTIASGVAFILPVVIDDTREPDALVPDRFRTVQWTRLPGGVVPPEVQARFLRLWAQRTGGLKQEAVSGGQTTEDRGRKADDGADQSRSRKRNPVVLVSAMLALLALVALAVWRPWQRSNSEQTARPELAERATSSLSEARQLIAKAWDLMNRPDMARVELDAADNLCQQAAALDSNDAEVWAAWSQVDSWFVYHRLERTPARQDGARTKAARALSLAPNSYEARLAQACYLVREGGGQSAFYDLGDAERLLQTLLRENPNEPRALWALGILLRNTGKVAGYRDAFTRMANAPGFAVQAYNELGWAELFNGNHREAEAAADASIALQPYWANLNLKTYLLAFWWGDLEQARATVDRISGTRRQEDYAVSTLLLIDYFRRDPDAMLRVTNRLSRDWLESNAFDGPVAWWNGLAREMTGQDEAAQLQWRTALTLVERRLADQPGSSALLRWKARLLLATGNQTEGATAMRLAREMESGEYFFYDYATDEILLGDLDGAVTVLEQRAKVHERDLTAAYLRISPEFDALRDLPRFQALLARLEADPHFSPNAKVADASSPSHSLSTPAPTAPDKSVAVLAFTNLSDDRDNEYFSDGISEELLNVLAKVPGLKVTARTSAFYFKGKQVPIADIAQQLGVAYVVEGSVRKQGDRVRISAQLIKASDGFNLWSDTFDRDLKDIFAVQDEIAGLIAQNLSLKMGVTTTVARAVDPEVHELYLRALGEWKLRTDEAIGRVDVLLRQALSLDPGFSPAYALRAETEILRLDASLNLDAQGNPNPQLAAALAWANKAMELDPQSPDSHVALGGVYSLAWRLADAEREFREAIRLNPNHATAHLWLARLLEVEGKMDEAIVSIEKAAELDPLFSRIFDNLALIKFHAGRYTEARNAIERALVLQPDNTQARAFQIQILIGAGDLGQAQPLAAEFVQQAMAAPSIGSGSASNVARVLAGLDDREKALAIYERIPDEMVAAKVFAALQVGREGEAVALFGKSRFAYWWTGELMWNPLFDPIREQPGVRSFLEKAGLLEAEARVQAWHAAHPPEKVEARP